MRIGLVALTALMGCGVDPAPEPATDDVIVEPIDTAPPPDTGPTDTGPERDTAPVDEWICDEPAVPEIAVDPSCYSGAGIVDWALQTVWEHDSAEVGFNLHAGRFTDNNHDGTIDARDGAEILVSGSAGLMWFDGDGALRSHHLRSSNYVQAQIADLDPAREGVEAVASYPGADGTLIGLFDESGVYEATPQPEDILVAPWVTDLEGDGELEILLQHRVLDVDGEILTELEGGRVGWMGATHIAADLDRDGAREIIGVRRSAASEIGLFAPDGSRRALCASPPVHGEGPALGVGELDGDPDGEFVVAGEHYAVVCDADGALLHEVTTSIAQPAMLAIGELDGDAEPEILISGQEHLLAMDHELNALWTYDSGATWYPFSLADLDADGRHEILLQESGWLHILDGTAHPVGTIEGPTLGSWRSSPIVADVDGDGLAEIVTTGYQPMVSVIENATGGWNVEGAALPWAGLWHDPGSLRPGGGLRAPEEARWNEPAWNVWNGLPSGLPGLADLGVEIAGVCAADCGDDAQVVAWVSNRGPGWLDLETELIFSSPDGATEHTRVALDLSLAPGAGERIEVSIPAADLSEGLRAAAQDAEDSCGLALDEAIWEEPVCP